MLKRIAQDPHQENIRVVWHEPTQFDHLRHGPPYLPKSYEAVKLGKDQRLEVKQIVRTSAVKMAGGGTMLSMLAMLQALALLHQTHHWSTSGVSFSGDHLLFERLYNESLELIDQLAERIIGSGDSTTITAFEQATVMADLLVALGPVKSPEDMVRISLGAEATCVTAISQLIATMKAAGTLSHGISKLLEDIADKHETFVYLLKQRSQTETYDFR